MSILIAYDAAGNVVGTLDYMTAKDANGNVIGHYDFEALERSGARLRDLWQVDGAVGSAAWSGRIPLGPAKVELDANKRITAVIPHE